MLKEIKEENRNYISLNELNLMSLAKNDPKKNNVIPICSMF